LSNWISLFTDFDGDLGVLASVGGAVFASLSGSSMANTAMMGTILVPEMNKRGYSKTMTIGPILGAGGLAMIIPPSSLAVLLGGLAQMSVGKLLISGIIPGLLLTFLYLLYIVGASALKPSLAPSFEVEYVPWSEKIISFVRDVLPLSVLFVLAIGMIFFGVATPAEAAALGAVGAIAVAAGYRALNWQVLEKSLIGTIKVTAMTFMIVAASAGFSQILAYSGASRVLVKSVLDLPLAPIVLIIMMQLIVMIMGCFIEQISIMMITLPMFMPVVNALGYDPVWFGLMMLINLELAMISPPFGLMLFVMKGVAPEGTSMGDIWKAAVPFIICDLLALALILIFPQIALWLPNLMTK
jgi:tripartite ATP-independent transporter DctM subunit